MDDIHDATTIDRLRERVAFFKRYYDPVASNSTHGLAVIEDSTCSILYANLKFLASHGLAPRSKFPLPCHAAHGGSVPCVTEGGKRCSGASACKEGREIRQADVRGSEHGISEGVTEIIAYPIGPGLASGGIHESVIIEKGHVTSEEDAGSLDEEREYLATIVRHSADAVIGLDGDGLIRSWNHGAEEIFGYTGEDALGQDFRFLVPDDRQSREDFNREIKEFRAKGILKSRQARLSAKDGRTVVVNFTSSLVRDATGSAIGISVIGRDVTMEVLLKELIDHQIRAMTVTHEIGDVLHSSRNVDEILNLILLGVTAGQGLGFNRAFLLLVEGDGQGSFLRGKMAIGPSNPAEAGTIWSRLANERMGLSELYAHYMEDDTIRDVEVNHIIKGVEIPLSDESHVLVQALRRGEALNVLDGKVIGDDQKVAGDLIDTLGTLSFAVIPLNTRDRAIGVLLVDNKITGIGISDADIQMLKVFANHAGIAVENSRLRESLEGRLEELADLNKKMTESQGRLMRAETLSVIGEMAARIAHEVRNPLVSIGGFARLIRRGIDANDPRSDYLRIISDEVQRLERILGELLDYSRPTNALDIREVMLGDLLREVVAIGTVDAEASGVSVAEEYEVDQELVSVDPDKTRQVLLNLIRNALDVMPDTGKLEITSAPEEGGRIRITVVDSGPGIPKERRKQVFQPGFTTRADGMGFGLAISKRLMELQGGEISLRDNPPPGCTFDILLPRFVEEHPEVSINQGENR